MNLKNTSKVLTTIFFSWMSTTFIFSNPSGEKVVSGQVEFQKEGNTLSVKQGSDKSIINWKDFSIQKGEHTKFVMPSKNSTSLNRVVGEDVSAIYGKLEANGKLYLINPNGVFIGPEGRISANSFVASTLDFSNEEFLFDENKNFLGTSDCKIINQGEVEAISGDIYLIAKEVINEGKLFAKEGIVGFGASKEVFLAEASEQHIAVKVGQENGYISNEGEISCVQAELKAAGGNIYSLAINQDGLIEANGFEERDGQIILLAEQGMTNVSGKMKASIRDKGGIIQVLGDHVKIYDGGYIDVSGINGGGIALIGGDYQGNNPAIKNAKTTWSTKESTVNADALESGNGGKVILWADDVTWFYGDVSARGGSLEGDGGFIEVSGLKDLLYKGNIDTVAINGQTGKLLLDPCDITISGGASVPAFSNPYEPITTTATLNVGDLTSALATSHVEVKTGNTLNGDYTKGHITVSSAITWHSNYTLTLNANSDDTDTSHVGNVAVNANITCDTGTGGIIIKAHDYIDASLATISILGDTPPAPGSYDNTIYLQAHGRGVGDYKGVLTGAIASVNGDITIIGQGHGTGANSLQGVDISNGTITVTGTGNIDITGIGATATSIKAYCYGVSINENITTTTGDITIDGTGGGRAILSHGIQTMHTKFETTSGNISLTGRASTSPATTSGYGVRIISSSYFRSTSGDITINGTSADSSDVSKGVGIEYTGTFIQTGEDGNVSITGHGVAEAENNEDIWMTSAGIIADTGTITITGNYIEWGPSLQGNGPLIIQPRSAVDVILAGTGPYTDLIMSAAEINTIQDGFSSITFGNSLAQTLTCNTDSFLDPLILTAKTVDVNGTITLPTANDSIIINIGPASAGTLHLDNPIVVSGTGTINLNGGDYDDTFNLDVLVDGGIINGGAGSNVINGNNSVTMWTISGNDSGSLTDTISTMTFSYIQKLVGGTAADVFTFSGTGKIGNGLSTTGIHGGTGTNTLTGSTVGNIFTATAANTGTIQPIGQPVPTYFTGVSTINGNTGTDTLLGPTDGGIWGITADSGDGGTGTIASIIAFTKMNNLTGGSGGADTFNFDTDGVGINLAMIDGNSDSGNVMNFTDFSTVDVQINLKLEQVGFPVLTLTTTMTYDQIQSFDLSSSLDPGLANELVAKDSNNIWTIDGVDTFTINDGAITTRFNNIGTLTGGTGTDSYVFSGATASISGQIDGVTGATNTIDYSGYTGGVVTVDLADSSATAIYSGAAAGFSNIHEFIGTPSADTLNGATAGSSWHITGDYAGTSGAYSFSGIENLVGGSGGDDTFIFDGAYDITSIDGNSSGSNNQVTGPPTLVSSVAEFAVTASRTGTITVDTVTTSLANIDTMNGTGSYNTLEALPAGVTWNITGDNAGNITSTSYMNFTGMNNLLGAAAASDTFNMAGNFRIDGTIGIDGGGSVGTNTINGPDAGFNWTISDTSAQSGSFHPVAASSKITNFSNIDALAAGTASDTLIGPTTGALWNITSTDGGDLDSLISFSSMQNFIGGTGGADTFAFDDSIAITGTINGGNNTYENVLDYSEYTSAVVVHLQNGTATGTVGVSNIRKIIAGQAANTLTGADSVNNTFEFQTNPTLASAVYGRTGTNTLIRTEGDNSWTVSDENDGTVGNVTFTDIDNLMGGTGDDTFYFNNYMEVLGYVNGGTGDNTLNFEDWTARVYVQFNVGSTTAGNAYVPYLYPAVKNKIMDSGFSNIQNFVYVTYVPPGPGPTPPTPTPSSTTNLAAYSFTRSFLALNELSYDSSGFPAIYGFVIMEEKENNQIYGDNKSFGPLKGRRWIVIDNFSDETKKKTLKRNINFKEKKASEKNKVEKNKVEKKKKYTNRLKI